MNNKLIERKLERWHRKYSDYSPELKEKIKKLVDKFDMSDPFDSSIIKKTQTKSTMTGKRFLR